jgi:hypothetical protein
MFLVYILHGKGVGYLSDAHHTQLSYNCKLLIARGSGKPRDFRAVPQRSYSQSSDWYPSARQRVIQGRHWTRQSGNLVRARQGRQVTVNKSWWE